MIAIKKHIPSFRVNISSPLEILWVCIMSSSLKSLLGICYRPPDSSDSFVTNLHANLLDIRSNFPKADIYLFGDFNYPNINWNTLTASAQDSLNFVELTLDFSLTQLVSQPTRDLNILDLVLTSAPDNISPISLTDGFSDHKLLHFTLKMPSHIYLRL